MKIISLIDTQAVIDKTCATSNCGIGRSARRPLGLRELCVMTSMLLPPTMPASGLTPMNRAPGNRVYAQLQKRAGAA